MDEQNPDAASTPHGNRPTPTASSAGNAASTPVASPKSSATTGSAAVSPMPIGPQHSAIVAARSAIEEALRRGDPAATDRVLAESLGPFVNCSLPPRTIDQLYGDAPDTRQYDVRISHVPATKELLAIAMRPLSEKAILAELGAVRVMTVTRNMDGDDLKFQMEVYARKLQDYPGDAVRAALRRWPDEHKFWPSFAELVDAIWRTCEYRKLIKDALE